MKLAESLLYALTKRLSLFNMGQSQEMAEALEDGHTYADYRAKCIDKVLDAARRYSVEWRDQDVLDLGCYDGAVSRGYLDAGSRSVIGIDIDEPAVLSAQRGNTDDRIEYRVSGSKAFPVNDASIDTIFSYDVFEHVEYPAPILEECYRVLRPGGKLLIGTWGWHHPFAPHLWSTMPVPWAHVMFSEKTVLRTCRRVYESDWYVPNMHDFDMEGRRVAGKYSIESIPTSFVNKYLVSDFERTFRQSSLTYQIYPQGFRSRWAAWTKPLLHVPLLNEFFTAYIWVVLERPAHRLIPAASRPSELVEV